MGQKNFTLSDEKYDKMVKNIHRAFKFLWKSPQYLSHLRRKKLETQKKLQLQKDSTKPITPAKEASKLKKDVKDLKDEISQLKKLQKLRKQRERKINHEMDMEM